MGAGAELGIYERATFLGFGLPHWNVNYALAMKMKLKLYYQGNLIIDYAPSERQWWITGFNPNYKNVSASDLTAVYTLIFNNDNMFNAFKTSKEYKKKKSQWKSTGKRTMIFTF